MQNNFYNFLKYVAASFALLLGSTYTQAQDRELDLPDAKPPSVTRLFFDEPRGYWTLGLNGGLSYQSSNVSNEFTGWGLGLSLAKNYFHQKNGFLDFDLRARGLYANSQGLNGSLSTGVKFNNAVNGTNNTNAKYDTSYFANYRNDMLELGLEGVFTFNRLREQHGILLQLYGGAGANWHLVNVNQLDANNAKYKYNTINTNQSISATRAAVKTLLDNTYETKADGMGNAGEVTLAPYLGVTLGFHVTPKFMIALGHKLTFTQTNIFDGQQWNNDNTLLGGQDLHHYTSLNLKWIINPAQPTTKQKLPTVDIYEPFNNPHITNRPNEVVKARVTNIQTGVDRLTMTVNGRNTNFTFYNGELLADIALQMGTNEVIVRAQNGAGSAEDHTVIIYRIEGNNNVPPTPTPSEPRPTVRITTPRNGASFELPNQRVIATVQNIGNSGNVTVSLNGQNLGNVYVTNNEIAQDVQLVEGTNRILVTARNSSGNASDEVTVYYRRPQPQQPQPTVRISRPTNGAEFEYADIAFLADVREVNNRNDINITLNGRSVTNFDFSQNQVNARLQLSEGTNRVNISVRNVSGSASDATTVYYRRPQPQQPQPTVRISRPTNGAEFEYADVAFLADVREVNNRNDINITLNGNNVTNFDFSQNQVNTRLQLSEGTNRVNISVRNVSGSASDATTVYYRRPQPRVTPPSVRITQFNDAQGNDLGCTTNLVATTMNVENYNQISITLNGRSVTNFTFEVNRQEIRASLPLASGNNNVLITVRNEAGNARDERNANCTVQRELPRTPPSVRINDPANGATVSVPNLALRATVRDVPSRDRLRLTLNGQPINFTYFAGNQTLTANLNLVEGANEIYLRGENNDGVAEDRATVIYKKAIVIPRPPKVTITQPFNNSTVNDPSVGVRAMLTNVADSREVEMTVNGQRFEAFRLDKSGVNLTARVENLQEGQNIITITATNKDGSDRASVNVKYEKRKTPPTVRITTPTNGSTIGEPATDVRASITNINDGRNIRMTINGQSFSSFRYENGTLTARAENLVEGSNNITIEVSNADGTDRNSTIFTYIRQKTPPTAKFTNLTNSTIEQEEISIQANVRRVLNQQSIKLYVNGASIDFTFDPAKGNVRSSSALRPGVNDIKIVAQNGDGTAEDRVVITRITTPKPTVRFTMPASPNMKVPTTAFTVRAITNVRNREGIDLRLNGTPITNFTLQNEEVSAPVTLVRGNNEFTITVTNKMGSESAQTSVISEKLVIRPADPTHEPSGDTREPQGGIAKPIIQSFDVTRPLIDPMNPNPNVQSVLTARLQHVQNANQIELIINGVVVRNSNFDAATGILTHTFSVRNGNYTIQLKATNAAGSVEQTKTFTF